MLKSELDTPSLILDIDIFEENLKKMRDFVLAHGKKLRPHAKTHKCPEIAKRQLACGNCIGICAAKLAEAEGLAAAGIQDILITSPVTAPWKMKRVMELNQKIANLQVTVDNVEQIKMLAELAVDKKLHVLIDVDPEMGRTGVAYNEALSFGRFINGFSSLVLDGVQCYAGHLQHIVSAEERAAASTYLMQKGAEVFNALKQEIPTCRIFTGTGTGTSAADVLIDEVTDIQVGSYCMMDAEYLAVEHQEVQYRPALRMLSSVISANHSGNATIDAGTKAIYVTPGAPPQVIEKEKIRKDMVYSWDYGDEHGHLMFAPEISMRAGDRVELIVSHCDPTVNLFDELYIVKGDEVIDKWEITLRGCCK
ncbi:MAG: alanine racemase [Lentisphaeria bacterium]|nr:alanine racemase [Lentisphaeria bacterium]